MKTLNTHLLTLILIGLTWCSFAQTSNDIDNLLGTTLDKNHTESHPFITADESSIYFIRRNHPQNMGGVDNHDDIWVSKKDKYGEWGRPLPLGGPLNNRRHNRVVGASSDGKTLYLASFSLNNDQHQVWVTQLNGRVWTSPKLINFMIPLNFTSLDICHVSMDGKILLLSGESDNGQGGRDIYACSLQENNQWGTPVNLGPSINTSGDELSACLAVDKSTLYFSSSGHYDNLGGQDIFMSKKTSTSSWVAWSNPESMGDDINSSKEDLIGSVSTSGESILISSNVDTEKMRIYKREIPSYLAPNPVILLQGNISDALNSVPSRSKLFIRYTNEDFQLKEVLVKNGQFQMVMPYQDNMVLHAEVDNYFSISKRINLSGIPVQTLDGDSGMLANAGGISILGDSYAEVEKIQLRLTQLDKELRELEQEKRDLAKQMAYQRQREDLAWADTYRTDPELDALKHKYNDVLRKKGVDREYENKPSTSDSSSSSSKDRELNELRKKFNRHYSNDDKTESANAATTGASQSEEAPQFESVQSKIRRLIEAEQLASTQVELLNELFPSVNQQIQRSLNKSQKSLYNIRLRNEAKQRLRTAYLQTNNKENAGSPNLNAFEKQLKRTLSPKVKTDMRARLEQKVRDDIQRELKISIKKARETQLRIELDKKLKDLAKEEATLRENQNVVNNSKQKRPSSAQNKKAEYQLVDVQLKLKPLRVSERIPLKNIHFEANQATLLDDAFIELERILHFLQSYPKLKVEIASHTNGLCSYDYASQLTNERAEVIRAYMTDNGISPERITAVGYGKSKPIASNDTEVGRQKNQRIEMEIIE